MHNYTRVTVWVTAPLCKNGAGVRRVFSICVRDLLTLMPRGCLLLASRVFFQAQLLVYSSVLFSDSITLLSAYMSPLLSQAHWHEPHDCSSPIFLAAARPSIIRNRPLRECKSLAISMITSQGAKSLNDAHCPPFHIS